MICFKEIVVLKDLKGLYFFRKKKKKVYYGVICKLEFYF